MENLRREFALFTMTEQATDSGSHDLRNVRQLSDLGTEQYQQTVYTHTKRLSQIKGEIDEIFEFVKHNPVNLRDVGDVVDKLKQNVSALEKSYQTFSENLKSLRTVESVEENSKWKTVVNETVLRVQDLIEKVKVPSKPSSTKMSTRLSQHSKHSVLRSEGAVKQISEAMLKHSELLASAKARLKFAEEEAALLKQEAELQASKMTLKTKRDVEESKCNLEALYEMSDLGGSYEPPPTVDDHQDEDWI